MQIFTEGEGDGIESKLSTLRLLELFYLEESWLEDLDNTLNGSF